MRSSSRAVRVGRMGLQCVLMATTLFFTVATQAVAPQQRGEINYRRGGVKGHISPIDVLLIDRRSGRYSPDRVRTDKDGFAGWPYKEGGYQLVVGHVPKYGIGVMRPGPDGTYERERLWNIVFLGPPYGAALLPLEIYSRGYSAPMEQDGDTVTWANGPGRQWAVLAFDDGHYLVEALEEVEGPVQRTLTLPPGFRGEVFAVWGGASTERGATAPLHVDGSSGLVVQAAAGHAR